MDWQVEPLLWDFFSSSPRSLNMLILTEGLMHRRLSPSPILACPICPGARERRLKIAEIRGGGKLEFPSS